MRSYIPEMSEPFFETVHDGEWNACVGIQGYELNYIDGYLEAARILAATVIDDGLVASRDTLAMPILYNARHGLELALKYVVRELAELALILPSAQINHDIRAYWTHLRDAKVCDREARALVLKLQPFVESLARIDDDGQELRYFENREGDRSLGDLATVNLPLIRASIEEMDALLHQLTDRVAHLGEEHGTGTRTDRCSRTDLVEIARALGDQAEWRDPAFDKRKAALMERFDLSGRAFSDAVNTVKKSRALAAAIGIETPLTYLTDEQIMFVAERWRAVHPPRLGDRDVFVIPRNRLREEVLKGREERNALYEAVIEALSVEQVAELEALFYIGRDRVFGEHHEAIVERTLAEHRVAGDRWPQVYHILSKTNFLDGLIEGLRRVGRPPLADRLGAQRDGAVPAD